MLPMRNEAFGFISQFEGQLIQLILPQSIFRDIIVPSLLQFNNFIRV